MISSGFQFPRSFATNGLFRLSKAVQAILSVFITGAICSSLIAQTKPTFTITLKPMTGSDARVFAVDVSEVIEADSSAVGKPLTFGAPLMLFGNGKVADRVSNVNIVDASGKVSFTTQDDQGGEDPLRRWCVSRGISYPVTIRYRAAVLDVAARSNPPWGIKAVGGGFAGSGLGFLALPIDSAATATQLHWDLSALPAGSVGVITAGEGDVLLAGGPNLLKEQWMLAGPATVYRKPGTRFAAFALGKPSFDLQAMMERAGEAYALIVKAFPYLTPPPSYNLLFRAFDSPSPPTGTSFATGALLSSGKTDKPEQVNVTLRNVLVHEMIHRWVGQMAGEGTSWFSEGLTVYETTTLGFQSGLDSVDVFRDNVNEFADWYYTSSARDWPLSKIETDGGLGRDDIRDVPYGRGALYFADLDMKIRTRSHGRQTLNSVLNPIFLSRQNGEVFDQATWEKMLLRKLGSEAVSNFRTVIVGGAVELIPPSSVFGPCLRRETLMLKVRGSETLVESYEWREGVKVSAAPCGVHRAIRKQANLQK